MITLNTPISVISNKPVSIELTELTIDRIVDIVSQKQVVAFVEHFERIILWEDDAYDAIGNWTQEQAEARIIELIVK